MHKMHAKRTLLEKEKFLHSKLCVIRVQGHFMARTLPVISEILWLKKTLVKLVTNFLLEGNPQDAENDKTCEPKASLSTFQSCLLQLSWSKVIFFFTQDDSQERVVWAMDLNSGSVSQICRQEQDVCSVDIQDRPIVSFGGPGVVVKCDESKFNHKAKVDLPTGTGDNAFHLKPNQSFDCIFQSPSQNIDLLRLGLRVFQACCCETVIVFLVDLNTWFTYSKHSSPVT